MPKEKTPKFTLTLPLRVLPEENHVLVKSQQASRNIYNAVLGESLKRLSEMRQDKRWKKAGQMKKGKDRNMAYQNLREYYGFTKSSLEVYAKNLRNNSHIKDHIGSTVNQAICLRAFTAVEDYLYGERGRPRFKSFNRLRSLQAKSNKVGIIFDGETVKYNTNLHKMVFPVKYDGRAKELTYVTEALKSKISYCRLIHRKIKGKDRWYVQLILDGLPPIKDKHRKLFKQADGKTVGLDTGPSKIAIVGLEKGQQAYLTFAEQVVYQWKAVRRIQRQMDRSRRASNPDNYDEKGRIVSGPKTSTYSKRYYKLLEDYREMERILSAMRFTAHGELANTILSIGNQVYTENVSYKAWQKMFGRSAKVRGSGAFQDRLIRKAENAGGQVYLINTYKTKLSQYCHIRNDYIKKPLKQREHVFPNGNTVQRDIYSAFLATCVKNCDTLDTDQVRSTWKVVDSYLNNPVSTQAKLVANVSSGKKRLDCKSCSSGIIADSATMTASSSCSRSEAFQQE